MDNLTYLNQISQSNRPVAPQKTGLGAIFTPKMIKILAGALVALILIIIFGSMLGNMNGKSLELTKQLELRMENLSATLEEYKDYLKSPSIRSANASLSSLLLNDTKQLTTYLLDEESYDASEPDETLAADETSLNDELKATLEDARLNGVLDRTYVREINLQIAYLLSIESEISERTDSDSLKSILETSYSNLSTIKTTYEKLNAAE